MSKYITIKDERENLDELLDKIDKLENLELRIGVFKEDNEQLLMIARVHEYGVQIKVTEKMRNYLHTQGLHLKSTTEYINIPERSYIRSTADKDKKKIIDIGHDYLKDYLVGNSSFERFTTKLGNDLADLVRMNMFNMKSPKNHPFTIEKKGRDDPLIDKGNLVDAITYKVVM